MATTTWAFGSLGSGFYATVTFDGVNFKISCIEGAFDLNALWFSDGDGTSGEGGATLKRGDASLSMDGTKAKCPMDGTKVKWDDYAKLSSPGSKIEKLNSCKSTFLTAGEDKTYSLSQLQLAGLNQNADWSSDWSKIKLGLRATSVYGVPGTRSIKLVASPSGGGGDTTPPVADAESATISAGGTSGNLQLLTGDTDSPGDPTGANLSIGTVNGTAFASLSDSADGTYTAALGFKQVTGTYGTLYVKADGTAYYVNDGSGSTDTFTYQAKDLAGNLSNTANINLKIYDWIIVGQDGSGNPRYWGDVNEDSKCDAGDVLLSIDANGKLSDSNGLIDYSKTDWKVVFQAINTNPNRSPSPDPVLDLNGFDATDKLEFDFTALRSMGIQFIANTTGGGTTLFKADSLDGAPTSTYRWYRTPNAPYWAGVSYTAASTYRAGVTGGGASGDYRYLYAFAYKTKARFSFAYSRPENGVSYAAQSGSLAKNLNYNSIIFGPGQTSIAFILPSV